MGSLASYEADAYELATVGITVIPGLLQTYGTAVGVLTADGVPAGDIEMCWMARHHRQQILAKVEYQAFISETALRTLYGGRDAVREQLEHLLRAQGRGIGVRVISAHQTGVTTLHPFHMMRFRSTTPVVYVELAAGGFYVHDNEVEPYESILQRLDRTALSPGDTRTLVRELMEGL